MLDRQDDITVEYWLLARCPFFGVPALYILLRPHCSYDHHATPPPVYSHTYHTL